MKISIITICKNNKNTIKKTIQSVINQKFKKLEYIVIDGASTDGTSEIIKKNLKYINKYVREKDLGIYDALNKGVKLSTGDIIGILHAGDIYYDYNILQIVADNFSRKIDLLIGDVLIEKNNKIYREYKNHYFKKNLLNYGICPSHPSSFFLKKVYNECGLYDTNYQIAGDFDFFVRTILLKQINYKIINKYFVIMEYGGKSNQGIKSIIISSIEMYRSLKKNLKNYNFFKIFLRFPFKIISFIK